MPEGPVWVIEPHADDAFLSLGAHLDAWAGTGAKVTIVTVFSGTRTRGRDAARFARAVDAEWVGLGLTESGSMDVSQRFSGDDFRGLGDEPGHVRVWPLGLRHAEHRAIASAAPDEDMRYLDQPYATRPRCSAEVDTMLFGRLVNSYLAPGAAKARHVDLFKDQSLFFHRLGPEGLRQCIEVIVS